ncbi:MAG: precorrin-6Y C5,15-methyltransferase (decarboxylating) subunit CbiT [Clostridium sp.]
MVFINDEEFIRGKCPMTKKDVRILTISKMNLEEYSKVLDIGSGTGSITIQCAKIARKGMVYAIERDEEAFNITKQNIKKFKCKNIKSSKGEAKEYLETLIEEGEIEELEINHNRLTQNVNESDFTIIENNKKKFDSIFIGGSGGDLEEIISLSNKLLKPKGTLVMNFITLNNAYKGIDFIKTLNYKVDISLVNISNNKNDTFMMIANNPIFIIECRRKEVE